MVTRAANSTHPRQPQHDGKRSAHQQPATRTAGLRTYSVFTRSTTTATSEAMHILMHRAPNQSMHILMRRAPDQRPPLRS